MKIKLQVTWFPWLVYLYTAIQSFVKYYFIDKNQQNSDNLLLYGTIVAILWIERNDIIAAIENKIIKKVNIINGIILFLFGVVITVIGRQISALSLEVWGLFLLASSLVIIFSQEKLNKSGIFIAISGTIIVMLGRLAPAIMSSDMAVSISTMAAFILDKIIPPVISRGVEIYFGPYVVEVVQACSGMNSMFSLFALSVIYMRYEESRKIWQMIILIALVVPVAIITNLLRVIILIMITHFSGEAMSQGIFHDITGIFSFVIALVFLGSVDHLLVKISNK